MKTPYTTKLRHGMPKSRTEQEAFYDGIVCGMVRAGWIGGVLACVMLAAQFFTWASNLANPNLRMTTTMEARK